MVQFVHGQRSTRQAALGVLVAVLTTACGARIQPRPIDTTVADRYLLERGREAAAERRWTEAREYFRQLVENHPGSPLRAEAKLATGDAYLSEASAESLVLAANEYREFLVFYPNDPRADHAQYSIAMTFFTQMRKPGRDQTPTRAALREFDVFFERYPMSPRTGWAKRDWRVARYGESGRPSARESCHACDSPTGIDRARDEGVVCTRADRS